MKILIKIHLLMVLMLFIAININAQIKVRQTGKVIIGNDRGTIDDANNVITAQIFGPFGEFRYGGKLAFGDFGSTNSGWNAFIGEYGNYDSDRLWLHGKNGIYLTWNKDNIIGSFDVNQPDRFTFNTDIYASSIKLTSDSRLKTNISKISNSLTQLRKLNGVSYNLVKKEMLSSDNKINLAIDEKSLSIKEAKDKLFFNNVESKLKEKLPRKIGFIAQDLAKIFPDLVDKDSSGYYSVDYIGLIPVIVEALKEQDILISSQTAQIEELKNLIRANVDVSKFDLNHKLEVSYLNQNFPNPFNQSTKIGYYLTENTKVANINIYNLTGLQIKSIEIQKKGNGAIILSGSELKPGIYMYTLIADGKEIDTKKMILTN